MNVEKGKFTNEDQREVAAGRKGPNVTLIVLGVVILLFVVFFLQNGERQSVDFLFFERTTTVRWSLVVAVVLGVLLDRAFTVWWHRRKRDKD